MKVRVNRGELVFGPFYSLRTQYIDGILSPETVLYNYEWEPDETQSFWQRLLDHIR